MFLASNFSEVMFKAIKIPSDYNLYKNTESSHLKRQAGPNIPLERSEQMVMIFFIIPSFILKTRLLVRSAVGIGTIGMPGTSISKSAGPIQAALHWMSIPTSLARFY